MRVLVVVSLLVCVLFGPAVAVAQTNWPKAMLTLKNNRPFKAELLGRRDREWMRIRRLDNPAEIQLPDSDVVAIEFDIPVEESGGLQAYAEGRFADAADRLGPLLDPTLRFMNVSNNLMRETASYIRSLYWSGRHTQTVAVCDVLLVRSPPDEGLGRDATMYRLLSLFALQQYERVDRAFQELKEPAIDDEGAVEFWMLQSMLLERARSMEKLQEVAARVIAFRSRSIEWMPQALVYSARSHLATGEVAIAQQILEEIELVYPRAPCSNLVVELRQALAARAKDASDSPDSKE